MSKYNFQCGQSKITLDDGGKNVSFYYSPRYGSGTSYECKDSGTTIIKSFKDVISIAKGWYANNSKQHRVFLSTNDRLIVYTINENAKTIFEEFQYKYENINIEGLFKTMTGYNNNYFVVSLANKHHVGLLRYNVLEILLLSADSKFKDEPLIHKFQLKQKNGKIRDIVEPLGDFKAALVELNTLLQAKYDRINDQFQVAYKKGKSILDNAGPHLGHKFVRKTDIHSFFPSCSRSLVEPELKFLFDDYKGYNQKIIEDLFYHTILVDGALCMGFPISGTIANKIISEAVRDMRKTALKYGITTTVYADDITFSSDKKLYNKSIIKIFNESMTKFGLDKNFLINEKKCIGQSNNRRNITGITINHKEEITTPRFRYNHIRQSLYQLSKNDTSHFNMQELKGQIAFVLPNDFSEKYIKLFKKYEPEIFKYKLISKANLEKFYTKQLPEFAKPRRQKKKTTDISSDLPF